MNDPYGKPAAKKVKGCTFWDPAVTTAFGPKVLPHGERQESAHLAKKEATRILNSLKEKP